ncbi:MAG: family 20 glycosylhydrolase, partial [Bacteroidota bacterium]
QIKSGFPEGISRGISALQQLILLNKREDQYFLPQVIIKDDAAFQHRGLLLDCSRHFFEVDVVKKYIDLLAFYKMNTLHWHLTEDQGWRIEIDKYPLLTEISAYRTEKDGSRYGGFYTKDQIRDVVAYAAERNITIIPEIEMPGHSQAALAAYPELSCTGGPIEVANDWGVFKEIYCAGNDSTFVFLEDVLSEVMELFPSKKIHIGGDEAPKTRWKKCPKCQRRIKEEGLADEHELQSYFIRRIQKFLNENGRQLIGWDEILEGGLAKGATVQSWRGMEGGIEAVKHGNEAIMSPTSHAYFDNSLDAIDLKKVYSFNPIPSGLTEADSELIIGGECNMWTERVPTEDNLDSKVFPRLLAMAEVLWSDSNNRDFSEFQKRVNEHYSILEEFGVAFGRESIPLTYSMEIEGGKAFLKLTPYAEDIEMVYSYECEGCDELEKDYISPIAINQSGNIQIQPKRNGADYGDIITIPVSSHLAIGSKPAYEIEFSDWYTAGGEYGLVDGKLGSLNFRDGAWQGFWGHDLVCTLELDFPTAINSITANFYQYNNSWIFVPKSIEVEVSADGTDWIKLGSKNSITPPEQRGESIETITVSADEVFVGKYIRLKAINLGEVPDWHEAAGSDAWIFIDEIQVR